MQDARPNGARHPPPRLVVVSQGRPRRGCAPCAAGEVRAGAARLRASLRALDLRAAGAEARRLRGLAANAFLHGLLTPLARLERAARESDPRRAFEALAVLEARLDAELAALPA